MRDKAQFLKSSLKENGLVVDDIMHERDNMRYLDRYEVKKYFGNDTFTYRFSITDETLTDSGEEKAIAMHAQEMAMQFEAETTDTIEMGPRRIDVSTYGGGWAECQTCGADVQLDERTPALFRADAELSTPNPLPKDQEERVADLDASERIVLEAYLVGKLREECDDICPNSRNRKTERFKYL